LYIPATEEYNNTNVLCSVAIRGVGFLDSNPVVLQVQGMLLPIYSPHMIANYYYCCTEYSGNFHLSGEDWLTKYE